MVQVAGGLHLVAVVRVLALLVGSTMGMGSRVLGGILGPLGGVLGDFRHVSIPDGVIFQLGCGKKFFQMGRFSLLHQYNSDFIQMGSG